MNPFKQNGISHPLSIQLDHSISVLRLLSKIFPLCSNFNKTFWKQTVQTLVRHHILQHLIWVCSLFLCPTKRLQGLYWLMKTYLHWDNSHHDTVLQVYHTWGPQRHQNMYNMADPPSLSMQRYSGSSHYMSVSHSWYDCQNLVDTCRLVSGLGTYRFPRWHTMLSSLVGHTARISNLKCQRVIASQTWNVRGLLHLKPEMSEGYCISNLKCQRVIAIRQIKKYLCLG